MVPHGNQDECFADLPTTEKGVFAAAKSGHVYRAAVASDVKDSVVASEAVLLDPAKSSRYVLKEEAGQLYIKMGKGIWCKATIGMLSDDSGDFVFGAKEVREFLSLWASSTKGTFCQCRGCGH